MADRLNATAVGQKHLLQSPKMAENFDRYMDPFIWNFYCGMGRISRASAVRKTESHLVVGYFANKHNQRTQPNYFIETNAIPETPYITFYEQGKIEMDLQMSRIDEPVKAHQSYARIAMHDYSGWRDLKN